MRPTAATSPLIAAGLLACNLGGGVTLDAGSAGDAGTDVVSDSRVAAEAEGGPDGGAEAITLVARGIVAITDRHCDLDGDGLGDNAVGDLGGPQAELLATAISAILSSTADADQRWLAHFPRVDDTSGPDDPATVLIVAAGSEAAAFDDSGIEDEDARQPDDDFSGEETFFIGAGSLDECGEPRSAATDAVIRDGVLDASVPEMVARLDDREALRIDDARAWGEIDPYGARAEISVCGSLRVGNLGDLSGPEPVEDLSFLEVFLGGGAALGVPTLPGVTPDLDLDGDGLERFVLDDGGRILQCVDGDGTVLEGRDCWSDTRMADGISLTFRQELVSARLAGIAPLWGRDKPGSCFNAFYCEQRRADNYHPCDAPCEGSRAQKELLDSCLAERCADSCRSELCPEECPPDGCDPPCPVDWNECWACAWQQCREAARACREAACCEDPPERSLWEPR